MAKTNSLAIMGAQWGDEGKGKIIDFLAPRADVVARFQGGDNAGHTVVVGGETFKLHHVPSGILNSTTLCLLGNGMVINPLVLAAELQELQRRGIDTSNLRISGKAHVIMEYHRALDEFNEKFSGERKIGTTGRGIGPAYADKAYRRGLRMMDFVDFDRLRDFLAHVLPLQNRILQRVYDHPGFDLEELLERYRPVSAGLRPLVADVALLLEHHLSRGKRVLYEGAQGTLLDLDHGTYPYVTASSTITGAIGTGLGIGTHRIGEVVGVLKAYTTRVGGGPFPTEDCGEPGDRLRRRGGEFGTTTGRPRRCGWFDAVVARYAARINGLSSLALTKLDVLSGLEKVYLATAYRLQGREITELPEDLSLLDQCEPVYRELPGWPEDISGARRLEDLPAAARDYLQALEETVGVRIALISVGPERSQTIIPSGSALSGWR
ncbi:MAG TPA: adenylosuccinate synthase [Bacillota bacterium]|nr:adenylosuccinate synthase [Bacillota bacterium]